MVEIDEDENNLETTRALSRRHAANVVMNEK